MRLFGHPVHVALVHFPIGLLIAALPFDALGLWRGANSVWWAMGFWDIVLGLIAALPTAATGLLDYLAPMSDRKAERAATWHMIVNLTAVALFGGSLLCRGGALPGDLTRCLAATGLDVLGAVALSFGGWLGGELVLRYGLGRRQD